LIQQKNFKIGFIEEKNFLTIDIEQGDDWKKY